MKNIMTESIDTSSGVLMPFFLEGNDILFLAGKGDGNIRYYEYESDNLHYLNEYKSADPQRGMTFLPRRALDVSQHEIGRAFKLAGTAVEPLSFIVPRKAENFQSDIFPPATSSEAALAGHEWLGGKDARPNVLDLQTKTVTANSTPIAAAPKRDVPTKTQSEPIPARQPSPPSPSPAPAPSLTTKAIPEKEEPEPDKEEASSPVDIKGDTAAVGAAAGVTGVAIGAGSAVIAEKERDEPKEDAKGLEIEQPDSEDEEKVEPTTSQSTSKPTPTAVEPPKASVTSVSAFTADDGHS